MVVPYPAGGATDVIGRIVADQLHAMWRTTVIVENVSGAAGSIGMDRVAKGPTDGTQILMVPPVCTENSSGDNFNIGLAIFLVPAPKFPAPSK